MTNTTNTSINTSIAVVSDVKEFMFLTRHESNTIVTHDEVFHGDETLTIVILQYAKGHATVLRTRDQEIIREAATAGATIVDVGGVYDPEANRFDHHQRDFSEMRPDGTKYSSAGLVWKEYGPRICTGFGCLQGYESEAVEIVDRILIRGIDAGDCGVKLPNGAWSLYDLLGSSNRTYRESSTPDPYHENAFREDNELFLEACRMADHMLWRAVEYACSIIYGRKIVDDRVEAAQTAGSKIVELPSYIEEWRETIIKSGSEALYGVFQDSLSGEWRVQAVPNSLDAMNSQRKPLPEAWRGLSGQALQEATGVEDAVFCHAGGFICGVKSKEGAMELARLAAES